MKLEINTPMNKFVPQDQPNFDDFTGNADMRYVKLAAFDSNTGAYTLQVVRGYAANPNYQSNGAGMYGQAYLYGVFEVKGLISSGNAPFPGSVGEELTNASAVDTWLKTSVGVTVNTMKSIAYGSSDGSSPNGTRYEMVTRSFDNMDIKLLAYDLPESAQMSGNDTLLGNTGTDVLYGFEGNDSIDGGAGLGLDHDRLLENRLHGRGQRPRHDIVGAAGRKRVDDGDRAQTSQDTDPACGNGLVSSGGANLPALCRPRRACGRSAAAVGGVRAGQLVVGLCAVSDGVSQNPAD